VAFKATILTQKDKFTIKDIYSRFLLSVFWVVLKMSLVVPFLFRLELILNIMISFLFTPQNLSIYANPLSLEILIGNKNTLKDRFGWKKSDKVHYYSELL